jgi:polysaccharide export outer membrane protein
MRSAFLRRLFTTVVASMTAATQTLAQSGTLPTSAVTLQPGDLVRIAVWRKPEFSGDFTIGADGAITHPLYRVIQVAGVPLSEVESRLRQFLTQYETQPAFSISPLLRIFVVGEVRQPSSITVPPGTTISQAIAIAGGPTDAAKLDEVTLIRGDRSITIDLAKPDLAMARSAIQSGDQIAIPRAQNVLRDVIGPIAALIAAAAAIASAALSSHK